MKKSLKALETCLLSGERLRSLNLSTQVTEAFLSMAALVTLRNRMDRQRPIFAGFIGCTGTGKSTLFNSLHGKDISITGWKAHNTTGPVLLTTHRFVRFLEDMENRLVPLLLPQFKRQNTVNLELRASTGSPGMIHWILTDNSRWESMILFDLPDINTTAARDENLLALELQPWLDTVIFMVDEETLYHRDYARPAELAKRLEQNRILVLNNRGRDRIELDHPDFKNVMEFFGVDTIHVLPVVERGTQFTNESAYVDFSNKLKKSNGHAPIQPIVQAMQPEAAAILEENERRKKTAAELESKMQRIVRDRLASDKPIPINQILHDDVHQVLQHLGLKRFSVSNIYHFLKKVASTGSLRKNLRLAFGSDRAPEVSQLLHLDLSKLENEVAKRLASHRENIQHTIRNHPNITTLLEMVPEWRRILVQNEPAPSGELKEVVDRFERQCKDLLASDTIAAAIKNDPLLTISLVAVLIADIMTIPGFGTWFFVPTAFKFLPIGKFEKVKRDFQNSIQTIVRQTLTHEITQLKTACQRFVLSDNDPLLAALRICADDTEN